MQLEQCAGGQGSGAREPFVAKKPGVQTGAAGGGSRPKPVAAVRSPSTNERGQNGAAAGAGGGGETSCKLSATHSLRSGGEGEPQAPPPPPRRISGANHEKSDGPTASES